MEDDDVSDEEIKTPKAKKAKRSGSGASVTVKPEGKGGREGPPRRVSKNGKPVVQCACGNVELEGEVSGCLLVPRDSSMGEGEKRG